MTLIDEPRATAIYADMAAGIENSGGSAANTVACIASFGGRGGYIGKVADDDLGRIFAHDLKSLGIAFDATPMSGGPSTARCLINVTKDAQRSMATFLGAAGHVGPDDVSEDLVAAAAITYLEGYLFEQPVARDAFAKAGDIARAAGRKLAITLSDGFVVDRNRDALLEFIPQHVDILFANQVEAEMLFGVKAEALDDAARKLCPLTAITMSEKGSRLVTRDGPSVAVPAVPPAQLVDTTGAGDAYAAGVLFGLASGRDLETAGRLGSLAASEVISHFGARPQKDLKTLAEANGLL
ncbi:MAG: adenosine kinase [Alphaproteobacteria bacterium]|nr:adenosine kinase [Alphaproteobacteria bacterium]